MARILDTGNWILLILTRSETLAKWMINETWCQAAIPVVKGTTLVPCREVKSLQLIWRLVTHRFQLWLLDLQISYVDLIWR